MTKSKSNKNQDDIKELLDLLEKLVELPNQDSPSAVAIRSAYRLKLFKTLRFSPTRVSKSEGGSQEYDALWEMLHRERTTPLNRVLQELLDETKP